MKHGLARVAAFASCVVVGILGCVQPAASADSISDSSVETVRDGASTNCFILLGGEKDIDGNSKVLANLCGSSYTDTKRKFDDQIVTVDGVETRAVLVDTRLMIWWQDTSGSYGSGTNTTIFGTAGSCDTGGYTVTPNSFWQGNMSAIEGFDTCNTLKLWDRNLYNSQVVGAPIYSMGFFNDNVGKVHVYCANLSYCP